jgi:hypothetical protein
MTVLLIVAAAWFAVLTLVTMLCASARGGDRAEYARTVASLDDVRIPALDPASVDLASRTAPRFTGRTGGGGSWRAEPQVGGAALTHSSSAAA